MSQSNQSLKQTPSSNWPEWKREAIQALISGHKKPEALADQFNNSQSIQTTNSTSK